MRARARPAAALAAVLAASLIAGAAAAQPGAPVPPEAILAALPPPPAVAPPTSAEILEASVAAAVAVRGRGALLALVHAEAARHDIPPELADAVVTVESSYDPGAVGALDEIGLMQVRPSTAAMLGHSGPERALFMPEVNVRYGVAYLAGAWRLAEGDLCRTLMKYRAGHGETRMSARSVQYCVRAIAHLRTLGSPLANAPVPQAVAVAATRPAAGPGRRAAADSALWRRHRERLREIESRLPASALSIAR